MAEKIVTEEEEKVLLIGPLSSGSLHSMGTHDSSSSLDWALDAAGSKVRCAVFKVCMLGDALLGPIDPAVPASQRSHSCKPINCESLRKKAACIWSGAFSKRSKGQF